jgi:alkyl hydroperoxide reductase 1
MSVLEAGDSFPNNVTFAYIPFEEENKDITACGIPTKFDASKEFREKKVVLVAVPGAFTPTCQANHLPGFIENVDALRAKGVEQVVVIASNDPFVMSAWGKANYTKDDFIIFATDSELAFSKAIGWTQGDRTARYAIAVDHGEVIYAAKEVERGVSVSGADAVLAKL